MRCPSCGAFLFADSVRCDCGYQHTGASGLGYNMRRRGWAWFALVALTIAATSVAGISWWRYRVARETRTKAFEAVMARIIQLYAVDSPAARKPGLDLKGRDTKTPMYGLSLEETDSFLQALRRAMSRQQELEAAHRDKNYKAIPTIASEGLLESVRLLEAVPVSLAVPKQPNPLPAEMYHLRDLGDQGIRLVTLNGLVAVASFQVGVFCHATAAFAFGGPEELRSPLIARLREARDRERERLRPHSLQLLDSCIAQAQRNELAKDPARLLREGILPDLSRVGEK